MITDTEINEYFANNQVFNKLNKDAKQKLKDKAIEFLSKSYDFDGEITAQDQTYIFPRNGLADRFQQPIDSNKIPLDISLALLALMDIELQKSDYLKSVNSLFDHNIYAITCLLSPYLRTTDFKG